MALNRYKQFRIGPEEEKRLAALSEVTGESQSAIMRRLILSAELVQRPTVAAGPLQREEITRERVAA